MNRLGNRTYAEYLASSEWHEKRRQAISRANGHCQSPTCPNEWRRSLTAEELKEIDQNGRFVLHIHHLTYTRIGNEDLDDLIVLCAHCHRSVHGLPQSEPVPEQHTTSMHDAVIKALGTIARVGNMSVRFA